MQFDAEFFATCDGTVAVMANSDTAGDLSDKALQDSYGRSRFFTEPRSTARRSSINVACHPSSGVWVNLERDERAARLQHGQDHAKPHFWRVLLHHANGALTAAGPIPLLRFASLSL